ncbi:MAG: hypothetical protein ACK5M4_03850 [Pseudorhodobacter sp.]
MGLLSQFREKRRRRKLSRLTPQAIFNEYFHRNKWRDADSRSGKGSNLRATAELRELLPPLLHELGVKSLIDIPCGDFFWMQHVDLTGIDYLGGDIVPDIIAANQTRYGSANRQFQVVDLISGPVPQGDLVFVRDCLVHLSHEHVRAALGNLLASGSTWLLATIHPNVQQNEDILTGQWWPLNLTAPPFNLPAPDRLIAEGAAAEPGQDPDKHLGLWRLANLAPQIAQLQDGAEGSHAP